MRASALAEKYAKALFECAKETGAEKAAADFLGQLKTALENKELLSFAKSPLIKPDDKKAAIMNAVKEIQLEDIFSNFLVLLAENNRLFLASDIHAAFQSLLDETGGVTRGTASSAKELSDAEKSEITEVIGKLTGKKVIMDFEVDSNLIGSLVAKVGSLTIDDSLKTHLKRLEDDLNRRV